jgi:NADH pyrophosphatase NudC (nudix superfamily)
MRHEAFDQGWRELAEEILTGMKEWRLQHPKATWNEIEAALDERLGRMRAKMLQDAALASMTTDWTDTPLEKWPVCPQCGQPLDPRVQQERHLQTHGGREVVLNRRYGVCPACGAGLFPPG